MFFFKSCVVFLVLMQRAIFLTTLVLTFYTSTARHPGRVNSDFSNSLFSDTTTGIVSSTISETTPPLTQILEDILYLTGNKLKFEIEAADVLNIEAVISHHKKLIRFNPAFMNWINRATGDKWGAYVLVAHEIGHHMKGHTKKSSGSRPGLELEADEFAGFVLAKLGASLEQAQSVMNYIATEKGSKTHPNRDLRMQAIKKGWEQG